MSKRTFKTDNRGISLMELVVSILIVGIVSSILVLFVQVSRNSYMKVATEAALKEEADYCMNFLSELVVEAYDGTGTTSEKSEGDHSYKGFSVKAPNIDEKKDTTEIYQYLFYLKKNDDSETGNLMFIQLVSNRDDVEKEGSPVDSALSFSVINGRRTVDVSATMDALLESGKIGVNYIDERRLVSKYVKDVKVSIVRDYTNAVYFDIELDLELMGETFCAHRVISGRNMR